MHLYFLYESNSQKIVICTIIPFNENECNRGFSNYLYWVFGYIKPELILIVLAEKDFNYIYKPIPKFGHNYTHYII